MSGVDRKGLSLRALAAAGCMVLGMGAGTAPPPAQPAKPSPQQVMSADPAKIAEARKFIMLYHPKLDPKSVAANLDKMMPRWIEARKKRDPKLDVTAFELRVRTTTMANVQRMLDVQSRVVAKHFTLDELKQLSAFFGSPLGRKLVSQTPMIQQDVGVVKKDIRQKEMERREALEKAREEHKAADKPAPKPKGKK